MNALKALRDHWLRIDARSLGLFRAAMGAALIFDLFARWRYIKEFYSNDGVLPNHNHLFNLRDTGQVWSVLHAFSTVGEAETAFCFILFFYACFLLGWHTRAFHALSLVCLVSLDARNVLTEGPGNQAAIALLAFTVFLPLGSRFSLDALLASLEAREEKGPPALNDRRRPGREAIDGARVAGWTPTSIAAFAALAQIAVLYLSMALQQRGPSWKDGSAMHYALHQETWVSAAGAWARGFLGPGALAAWTRSLHLAALAIPALIFFPAGLRLTRGIAVGLVIYTGLTLGVFFSFGLLGWTLIASAALLVPTGTWDLVEDHRIGRRACTMIYDVDCGVCLAIARLVRRLDLRGDVTFQGNDDLDGLNLRDAGGAVVRGELPQGITADLVTRTVIAVDAEGGVHTRARAVAEMIQALPLGWLVAWAMRLPGIVDLLDRVYDFVAARRQRISVAMGKEACGIDTPREAAEALPPPDLPPPPPSTRLRRGVTGLFRDLSALVILAAALAQTTAANDLPWKVPQPPWLAAVAAWPRMLARWDVLASPPTEDEILVVDAQTKGGKSVDPFTGKEPVFDPGAMRGTGLGQMWDDYLQRIHQRRWGDFLHAFRDYLNKGGPAWDGKQGDDQIVGYDAWLIRQPIPRPGEPRSKDLSARERIMTQARGGRLIDRALPILAPRTGGAR